MSQCATVRRRPQRGRILLTCILTSALFWQGTVALAADDDLLVDDTAVETDLLTDEDTLLDDDDLLIDEDSLLKGDGPLTIEAPDTGEPAAAKGPKAAETYHASLFLENRFPSASTCQACHPKQFREWSASPHAYAQLSPVANSMIGTMLNRTSGTIGDFCYRCHNPVGMNLGEPLFMSSMDRHPTSREGITCVVCHRIDRPYGKITGRLAMVEGDITQPIFGPTGNSGLKQMLENPAVRVVTEPDAKGRKIHRDAVAFSFQTQPGICGVCHDVTLVNGMRLEETFAEYKHAPAARNGTTCQDCHMGRQPGIAAGYDFGSAAEVGGVPSPPRRLTNHTIAGPDYSVVHPGIFPHNPEAAKMATIREWLTFDYQAGWGTDAFEDDVPSNAVFPDRWVSADDRYDAREILREQFERLAEVSRLRRELLRNGYHVGDVVVRRALPDDIRFDVQFLNATDGHNAPSGFERVVFFRVTVTDTDGRVVFRSGDLDPNGDLRDEHSAYVHNGQLPLDRQLFNLQLKFVTRNQRGGERVQVLPANFSIDPLPFVRPSPGPSLLAGRPAGARIQRRGVRPGDHRWARYRVPAKNLAGTRPPYRAVIQLIAGMVPVNLVNEIKEVGFDFSMTPRQVAQAVVDGHQVLWEREISISPAGTPAAGRLTALTEQN